MTSARFAGLLKRISRCAHAIAVAGETRRLAGREGWLDVLSSRNKGGAELIALPS